MNVSCAYLAPLVCSSGAAIMLCTLWPGTGHSGTCTPTEHVHSLSSDRHTLLSTVVSYLYNMNLQQGAPAAQTSQFPKHPDDRSNISAALSASAVSWRSHMSVLTRTALEIRAEIGCFPTRSKGLELQILRPEIALHVGTICCSPMFSSSGGGAGKVVAFKSTFACQLCLEVSRTSQSTGPWGE